jgi:hypothetical protein
LRFRILRVCIEAENKQKKQKASLDHGTSPFMFQSTPPSGRQQCLEEVTPLPNKIIPLKGEVSNRSWFLMNLLKNFTIQSDFPSSVLPSSTSQTNLTNPHFRHWHYFPASRAPNVRQTPKAPR